MNINAYLTIKKTGAIRLTKKPTVTGKKELMVKLKLNIPDNYFESCPVAEITVPKKKPRNKDFELFVNVLQPLSHIGVNAYMGSGK